MPQLEMMISNFGQHPTLVRRVNISVIVVDNSCNAYPRWAHQIHVAGIATGEHLRQNRACIKFRECDPPLVKRDYVVQAFTIEIEPSIRVVTHVSLCFDREAIRRKWPQKNPVEILREVF